ncbi:MAG: DUF1080 domain-containing protein [Blastocatellia bacterium]|nr:DUF1080 domain-containing protein [Blastocatellia bacterium]
MAASPDKVIGRWDITVQAADGASYPSWLEVTRDGDKLAGRFVGRTGSQRPVQNVEFADGQLSFNLPIQYERRASALVFKARLMGDKLEGTTTDPAGKELKWTARRAPSLARRAAPRWGKPVSLFNGSDLKGWKMRNPNAPGVWEVKDGAMVNAPRSTDIITERKFTDFKLHVEFKMVEKSNSGVYLRGRYEVQVQDDFGKPPDSRGIGGIYGFIAPKINAAKKAGEWQTFDITLIGRMVTVVLNGETIIEEAEIPGITGGALDSDESAPGPIMLQGDHTQIHYRNITITPAR